MKTAWIIEPSPLWLKSYLGPSEHCGSSGLRVLQFLVGFLFLVSAHYCFGLMSQSLVVMHLAHRLLTHPCRSLLLILVLLMVLAPTSVVWAPALGVQRMKFVHFETKIAQISSITNWMSRMDSHITETLGRFATRLTEMEENSNAFATRMCKLETGAPSGSSGPNLARLWIILGPSDGFPATGSLGSYGPGSSDDN